MSRPTAVDARSKDGRIDSKAKLFPPSPISLRTVSNGTRRQVIHGGNFSLAGYGRPLSVLVLKGRLSPLTDLWALGSEMLRNIESFRCPIRFRNETKNRNAITDFSDTANWDTRLTMEDVVKAIPNAFRVY